MAYIYSVSAQREFFGANIRHTRCPTRCRPVTSGKSPTLRVTNREDAIKNIFFGNDNGSFGYNKLVACKYLFPEHAFVIFTIGVG